MGTHKTQVDNIIKEIDSVKKEKTALSLRESTLFWKESGLWYKAKEDFFKGDKKESWASFLRKLKIPLFTVEFRVALYKKWIKDLGYTPKDLTGIHTKKLHTAISYVNTKKAAAQVLTKARELSYKEFLSWLKSAFKK